MANARLTDKTELTTPDDNDFLYIIDVSDTTESAQGTSKKIRKSNITPIISGKEDVANKQNSLAIDGTGTKYPTVDAVNAIDLQKVLDVGSYAETISSNQTGYASLLNDYDGEENLEFKIVIRDNTDTDNFSAIRTEYDRVEISSNNNSLGKSSAIQVLGGIVRITQRNDIYVTNIEAINPTVDTTLNFPAKTVAGDYTLATTDDVDAKITQTITNGVTDKSPSGDAVYDYLANVTRNIISNTTTGSTITGTISQTVLFSQLIPANTFKSGGFLNIMTSRVGKIGTAGTLTQTIRINTTNTLTGATIIASNLGSTANLNQVISRRFSIEGTTLKGFSTGNAPSDMINSSVAIDTYTFDPTIDNYIFEVGQLSNSGDSMFHSSFLLTN